MSAILDDCCDRVNSAPPHDNLVNLQITGRQLNIEQNAIMNPDTHKNLCSFLEVIDERVSVNYKAVIVLDTT